MKNTIKLWAKNITVSIIILITLSFAATIIVSAIYAPILLSENKEKEQEISMLKKKAWEMYIQAPQYKKNQELYVKFLSRNTK